MDELKRYLLLGLIFVIVGCTVFDKNNNYLAKPSPIHTIPLITCDGQYFSRTFPTSSKIVKLSDSTFGVTNQAKIIRYNDEGNRLDSVNFSSQLEYPSDLENGTILSLYNENGFAVFSNNVMYFISNDLTFLGKTFTNQMNIYPNFKLASAPNNTVLLETRNKIYALSPNNEPVLKADLSNDVYEVFSLASFTDGRIVVYAKVTDSPGNGKDLVGLFEIGQNGLVVAKPQFSDKKSPYFYANLCSTINGDIYVLEYEQDINNFSSRNTVLTKIETDYNTTEIWNTTEFFDRSLLSDNPNPMNRIKLANLGKGKVLVYADFYFWRSYIFDTNGVKTELSGFNFSKNSNSNPWPTAGRHQYYPNSIFSIRNDRFLVSSTEPKTPNYATYCCQYFTLVFSADAQGNFCR